MRDATTLYGRKRKSQRVKGEMGTNEVVLTHAVHGNDVAGSVSDSDWKKRGNKSINDSDRSGFAVAAAARATNNQL